MRILYVCAQEMDADMRASLCSLGELVLVMRLEENLGGVWSEYNEAGEMIRVGYPANSGHEFFRVLDPQVGRDTCASVVLGRTVFGRKISDVVVSEQRLLRVVAHALKGHDVRCWHGDVPVKPEQLMESRDCGTGAMLNAMREFPSKVEAR